MAQFNLRKIIFVGLGFLALSGCQVKETKTAPLPEQRFTPTTKGIFGTPGTVWQVIDNPAQQIKFEKGKISGFGGCNNFTTSVKINGAFVKFSPISATFKGCEQEISQKEGAFFQRFNEAHTFHSNSLTASVLDKTGSAVLKFVQVR